MQGGTGLASIYLLASITIAALTLVPFAASAALRNHRLASPREFYKIAGAWIPFLGGLFIVLCLIGSYWGLVIAPADYQQGDSFRIIYVHVPAAWMSLFIYMVMAGAGIVGLIWRIKTAFTVIISSAPIGAVFTFIALSTGSLWGKPMWGTYFGVIALYNAFDNRKTAEKAIAILSIVGAVNIPIIHYSVEWWNSLHQGSTVLRSDGPAMASSMLIPLLIMAIAFKVFYGWVMFMNARNMTLQQNKTTQWVKDLVNEGKR